MCIICLEFQKYRDIADARQMLYKARGEPSNIDEAHLDEVENALDQAEADEKSSKSSSP